MPRSALHAFYIAVEWKRARIRAEASLYKLIQTVLCQKQKICWRCTHKACEAITVTRDGTVVEECRFRSHAEKVLKTPARLFCVLIACKTKASERVMKCLTKKIIHTSLQETNTEQDGDATH